MVRIVDEDLPQRELRNDVLPPLQAEPPEPLQHFAVAVSGNGHMVDGGSALTEMGQDFGFPWFGGGTVRTDEYAGETPPEGIVHPAVEMIAHAADLGMMFYSGKMFPAQYRGGIFSAQHGSWNSRGFKAYVHRHRICSPSLTRGHKIRVISAKIEFLGGTGRALRAVSIRHRRRWSDR